MIPGPLFTLLDFIGMVAFSISGAIAGVRKKMDIYGIFILATVTAIGGGTLRDVLVGKVPVSLLVNPLVLVAPLLVSLSTFVIRRPVHYGYQMLLLMDAVGIGVFTISGVTVGLEVGVPVHGCVLLGVVTATAGGIIRDLLAGEIPIVLHKDIYASASLLGGFLYWLSLTQLRLDAAASAVVCTALVIVIRVLSYRRGWHLPYPHGKLRFKE